MGWLRKSENGIFFDRLSEKQYTEWIELLTNTGKI